MSQQFGRKLQQLRKEAGMTLFDVAQRMGCSSAFLSAIENEKKSAPGDFIERWISAVPNTSGERNTLQTLVAKARRQVVLALNDATISDVDLATALARKFSGLTDDQKQQISAIINRNQT